MPRNLSYLEIHECDSEERIIERACQTRKRMGAGWLFYMKIKKISLFILVIVFAFILSGCDRGISDGSGVVSGSSGNANPSQNNPSETQSVGTVTKAALDEELQAVIDTKVKISSDSNAKIQDFISNWSVSYEHDDLFNVEATLNRYYTMPDYNSLSSIYIQNNKVNAGKLRNQILSNNREFLAAHSFGSRFTEFSDADFDKLFTILVDTLEYRLNQTYIGIDVAELDEKLNDLKVYQTTDNIIGLYGIDGYAILALNPIGVANEQKTHPDMDSFKKIAIHEIQHLIQKGSSTRAQVSGFTRNMGIAYEWEDLSVNPLYCIWYFEGSAESLTVEYYSGITPTGYENYVKNIDSLTLALMLRDDVDNVTISKISLQKDLDKLFNIFGRQTENQKKEICNMMYAFELVYGSNSSTKSFYDAYENATGAKIDDNRNYESSLRASIAQTLTKVFYSNLVSRMSMEEVELGEVFSLVSLFENDMSRLTYYYDYRDQSRMSFAKPFLTTYTSIQNEFFGVLSEALNIDIVTLAKAYNAYNSARVAGNPIQLDFLSTEKNAFLSALSADRKPQKGHSVNEVFETIN